MEELFAAHLAPSASLTSSTTSLTSYDVRGGIGLPADEPAGETSELSATLVDVSGGSNTASLAARSSTSSSSEDGDDMTRGERYTDRFGNNFKNPYVASRSHGTVIEELWEDVYKKSTIFGFEKFNVNVGDIFETIDAIQEVGLRQPVDATSAASPPGRQKVLKRRLKLKKGITVDSGAANNVMPKRMTRDRSKIRPSPGSKRGAHFVAANDGRIPNEGEIDFIFKTTEGQLQSFVFQVAETNKPLGAASYFVDNGFRVIFDKDMKTGTDLSMMVNKATGEVTRFRRDRNIWVLDAIVEDEIAPPACHFHRHA